MLVLWRCHRSGVRTDWNMILVSPSSSLSAQQDGHTQVVTLRDGFESPAADQQRKQEQR